MMMIHDDDDDDDGGDGDGDDCKWVGEQVLTPNPPACLVDLACSSLCCLFCLCVCLDFPLGADFCLV